MKWEPSHTKGALCVAILLKGLSPEVADGHIHEALRLIEAAKSVGIRTILVCFSRTKLRSFAGCKVISMQPYVRFHSWIGNLLSTLQVATYLVFAIKREGIDILLANGADSAEGYASAMVGKITGRGVIIRMHGGDAFKSAVKYPFLVRPSISLCNIAVVLNNEAYQIVTRLGYTSQRVRVIPGMVDTAKFSPSVDGTTVRQKYGLQDFFVLLSVGRLERRKGVRILLTAMPSLMKLIPSIHLIIVGTGEEETDLKLMAEKSAAADRVIFTGYVNDIQMPTFYAAADVFVLPSLEDEKGMTEGVPAVLLEAASSGKPIVASDVGGVGQIVHEDVNGHLVEPGNPEALVSAIRSLLPIRQRWIAGENGRLLITERYGTERVGKLWVDLVRELGYHTLEKIP